MRQDCGARSRTSRIDTEAYPHRYPADCEPAHLLASTNSVAQRLTAAGPELPDYQRQGSPEHGNVEGKNRPGEAGVEYSVTDLGLSLDPIFKSLCGWATEHDRQVSAAQRRYDRAHSEEAANG